MINYHYQSSLKRLGANPPYPLVEILSVGSHPCLTLTQENYQICLYPAIYNGRRCWLKLESWFYYQQESIVDFQAGLYYFHERRRRRIEHHQRYDTEMRITAIAC